ncbi:MAG: DNA-directed RNA polymerase subunit beta, partial [Candidatus Latescibacterota bacterium]
MPRKVHRRSYAKLHPVVDMPDFLEMQLKSWEDFLQKDVPPEKRENKGLQAVFQSVFPVTDVSEQYALEFVSYSVGRPKYTVEECKERGMTYQAPLRARLRLVQREPEEKGFKVKEAIEQVVFLGDIPLMTEKGTFIINGVERVVVGQLHRSPGVFFSETIHPNGKPLYSARVVSYRGSWVEFSLDVHDVLFVHIERKRKLPATVLLRALGYSSDRDILELFLDVKEVPVGPGLKRWVAAEPVVGPDGQILVQALEQFDEGHIQALQEAGVEKVAAVEVKGEGDRAVVIWNTLRKDPTRSEKEALYRIYSLLRPGEPPSVDMAKRFFESLFFNPKRYDLGVVGRYQINRRLELDIPLEHTTLVPKDFIAILDYLLALWEGKGTTDDIDHLGNRRVRTVGEQLANQFLVGLTRMARSVRERLSLKEIENPTPHDLVNARTVSAVVQSFFATSQLSQFMDGTNPLAELTNKRRLSALGPGGLTRRRAGFEVRDVHHTHYGRICPIETPEGPNIGLITSLSLYARVNDFGFIETPYRKVVKEDGKVRVTDEIVYLTADQEDKYTIAQANAPLNPDGTFKNPYVRARRRGEFPLVPVEEVDFMDVSPGQLVSVSTSLIPFLEHDDANRALMGSNMQRQAVPLLKPEAPLVGTGIEEKVARDSRAVVTAEAPGEVVRVTADEIVVKEDRDPQDLSLLGRSPYRVYKLIKFARSNAGTCINQRPIVRPGDRVERGDVLADGPATDGGELALGANVLVAFMPWEGYNFEDAVVISERLCRDDVFTSVHIEEFELQVRDTKRGEEELTREIPNVGEDAVKNLDERGIVRIGAEVHPGDILVGKVTPKGEVEPTPEERLLRAIFGEKAKDVRDASLRVPPGMDGVVVDTKLFSRKPRDERTRRRDQERIAEIRKEGEERIRRIKEDRDRFLRELLKGRRSGVWKDADGNLIVGEGTELSEEFLEGLDFDSVRPEGSWTQDGKVDGRVEEVLKLSEELIRGVKEEVEAEVEKVQHGDELPPGILQIVKVYVARKRKITVGDKMAGRHGNKGVVAKIVPEEDMPYLPDGTPVDIVLNPLGVPSRMNLGQILETHLGWAAHKLGIRVSTPVFAGATIEDVKEALKEADLPEDGKTVLYDGRTGEPFDRPVTVGYIYMMKLIHMAEDKIHARAIGPYSLVTQQPLGGKAQFGGQRFGEMEVWALEAYGAAYTLQEMLTVKSDDVMGRARTYEALVKGENPPEPGIPEAFKVLVREMQGLGI